MKQAATGVACFFVIQGLKVQPVALDNMAPMKRFQNVSPEKRDAILDAAAAEIAAHGLGGASINRVIAAAGMSKSSFYHYFEGKDDLYGEVAQRALNELLAAMVPGAIPATPAEYWEMWEAIYVAFLRRQLADPVLAALNWSAIQARADGTAHPALEGLARQMRQWLSALVAQGQALGAVRTGLPQDQLMDATIAAWAWGAHSVPSLRWACWAGWTGGGPFCSRRSWPL